jgi:hypothetical protein
MMAKWLPPTEDKLPPNASHQVNARPSHPSHTPNHPVTVGHRRSNSVFLSFCDCTVMLPAPQSTVQVRSYFACRIGHLVPTWQLSVASVQVFCSFSVVSFPLLFRGTFILCSAQACHWQRCQLGTKYPILHANWDQAHPIGGLLPSCATRFAKIDSMAWRLAGRIYL